MGTGRKGEQDSAFFLNEHRVLTLFHRPLSLIFTYSDILQYIYRKSQSSVKMIEDELELVPFIAALDRTDQLQQGILSVVVGLFPDDVVSSPTDEKLWKRAIITYNLRNLFHAEPTSVCVWFAGKCSR